MNNPWRNIENPRRDVNVIRVSESHPLAMYWGKDFQGRYLFIYEIEHVIDPDKSKLPKLDGIQLAVVISEQKARLLLVLNDTTDWELFYSLCLDLIKATIEISEDCKPYSVIIRRLTRWQAFFRRRRSDLLSGEEIRGLIGELLMLYEEVSNVYGWSKAISFWQGPLGAPQDFLIYDSSIEVKCHSGGSKPTVKISSAEQLTPQVPHGYLAVYTITTSSTNNHLSFSLNDLVNRILNKLEMESQETRDRFEDLLCTTGYLPREEYDEPRYQKLDLLFYELRAGFPRIDITCIPPGIENISYSIKMEACKQFISKPYWREVTQ